MGRVYEPNKDSRLLASVACDVVEDNDFVVEVGTGTGYVINEINNKYPSTDCLGTDVNKDACEVARQNGNSVVVGSTTTCIAENSVDLLCFNPPYLPADNREDAEIAVAHEEDGAIREYLNDIPRVLSQEGNALLLFSSLTPMDIESIIENLELESDIEKREKLWFEELVVVRISKPSSE